MKQEERLFDLIGNLPDDLSAQTEAPKRKKITPKQRNRWIGLAVAAGLVVAFVGWGMTAKPYYAQDDANISHPDIGLPGPKLNWPKYSGPYASTSGLRFSILSVGERMAEYHEVEQPGAIPESYRPQYLGSPYENEDGWYRTADTAGLRYLVHQEEDGSYTLWQFSSFVVHDRLDSQGKNADFSPYSYAEVLETIYGITSAEDLVSVTVNPSNMDNTDAGKKLQKEIGSFTITDRAKLNTFYEAISSMDCFGSNHWDQIDLGDNSNEEGLLTSVRLCRYLTLETTNGTISSLKYSAAGGQFYEYSGIAYEPLDAETIAVMNEIFRIEA